MTQGRHVILRRGIWALALVLLSTTSPTATERLIGRVVRIVDGDTIVVDTDGDRFRVRLAAIDTPERDQPWGEAATREMRRLVAGREVAVDWYKKDRWGRLIGRVMVVPRDCPTCTYTLDAGLYQLTVGMAWHFKRYAQEQPPQERGQYEFAEIGARARKVG